MKKSVHIERQIKNIIRVFIWFDLQTYNQIIMIISVLLLLLELKKNIKKDCIFFLFVEWSEPTVMDQKRNPDYKIWLKKTTDLFLRLFSF